MYFAKKTDTGYIEVRPDTVPAGDVWWRCQLGFFELTKQQNTLEPNQAIEITFDAVEGKCREVVVTTTYKASINDLSKEISGVMLGFFEAKWKHIRTVTREGEAVTVMFTLQESHRREWQRMVWEKWQSYVQEYVETASAGDETSSLSGVKFSDLVMASYFGADWPLQPLTAGSPLTGTSLTDFIANTKEALKSAYEAVRARCIVTTVVQEECELALYHTANFIMLNVIPPAVPQA